jgi:sulfoquinovose isomerase
MGFLAREFEMKPIGDETFSGHWINDAQHRSCLAHDAQHHLDFFRQSLRSDGGFDVLDNSGSIILGSTQDIHWITRMIHSYALAKAWGASDCDTSIDRGMHFLWSNMRDATFGGYFTSVHNGQIVDDTKLAYGHVFVLLAASSAKMIGHPDADRMLDDITGILNDRFWDEQYGLFHDEFGRDWSPISDYRGYNSNMHGIEALLAAFEATGNEIFLNRAGRIVDFFVHNIAPAYNYALPEHYTPDWKPDLEYQGNPMFRPRGTNPGHSFELARLAIQWWDLAGRPMDDTITHARGLVDAALRDAWHPQGGFAYTLKYDGGVLMPDRYWWPVTEAIGALATLIKLDPRPEDETWYRRIWHAADTLFVDHNHGGWFHEIDDAGHPCEKQFIGRPDIYHSLQADIFPLSPAISNIFASFSGKS